MVGRTFQLSEELFINLPWISMEKPAINGVKHPFWSALFFVSFKLWVPSIFRNAYFMHSHIRNHLFCWRDFGRPGMFFLVEMCTLQATSMELKLDPRQSKRQCFMVESSQANPGSGFSGVSPYVWNNWIQQKNRENWAAFLCHDLLCIWTCPNKIEVLPAHVSAMT